MKTPKKPIKKSPLVEPDEEMEDSNEETTSSSKNKYDDDDDDFDLPLDDLDSFETYGGDDDDDDY